MSRRRGKGEGSICQRADGRWQATIDLGRDPVTGRRRRTCVYGRTEAEAIRKKTDALAQVAEGDDPSGRRISVRTYLEEWYATHRDAWSDNTRWRYRQLLDLYLLDAFGHLRLRDQLTPHVVRRWLTAQREQHGRVRAQTVMALTVFRSALAHAIPEYTKINAAKHVTVARPKARTMRSLTVPQAETFLQAAAAHPYGPLFILALATGLRLGELTGLRWDPDVDLATGRLQVRQQIQINYPRTKGSPRLVVRPLKTDASRRALTLPAPALETLRAYRTAQREARLKAGARWVDSGLVFTTLPTPHQKATTPLGGPLDPDLVRDHLAALLADADLPAIRFHDLRHSAASLLLALGVPLADVSKLLGHTRMTFTSDIYRHLLEETATQAAAKLATLWRR